MNIFSTNSIVILSLIIFMSLWLQRGIKTNKGLKQNKYHSNIYSFADIVYSFAYIGSILMLLLIFFIKYFYIYHSFQDRFVHFHILGIFTIMIGVCDFFVTLKKLNYTLKLTNYIIPISFVIIGIVLIAIKSISSMGKILGYDEVFYTLWTFIFIGTVLTGLKWNSIARVARGGDG